MRLRYSSVLAFGFPVAIAAALACTSGTYDDPCVSLGGACVTNQDQCGGSLPMPYGVPDASADETSAPTPIDSSTRDATIPDATTQDSTVGTDATSSLPDAAVATDSASPTSDATAEAEVPDQTAPVDAGQDVRVDSSTADASTHDSSTHDAAVMDAGASDTGSSPDAAPTCPGYAAPGTSALCTGCNPALETCQNNGCYGGYYCDLAKLSCVKASKVVCDAGI
jgi:hypothetical protein